MYFCHHPSQSNDGRNWFQHGMLKVALSDLLGGLQVLRLFPKVTLAMAHRGRRMRYGESVRPRIRTYPQSEMVCIRHLFPAR